MAQSPASDRTLVRPVAFVPWYIWCSALGVTSATIGAHWDISWHTSIGRDAFLTPAHIAIYLCGVLAAISCGYCILTATFQPNGAVGVRSVRIFGFRGPLGAFIASWGGIAMLTSAPFDNWWHDAYGLDVKIVSPPHVVLFAGAIAVIIGTLILTLGYMNAATGRARTWLRFIFLYLGAETVIIFQTLLLEFTNRPLLHSSLPYRMLSIFIPFVLAAVARASHHRFAATIMAGYYMLFVIAEILILPLFPAEPKLGPVYNPVTHFIPAQFPMLLIVPALALDLLWQRFGETLGRMKLSAISAVTFTVVLLAAEWPFASFLQTPAARNPFFGAHYMGYFASPRSFLARHQFVVLDTGAMFWTNIALAIAFAFVSCLVGFGWGDWMRKVRR